MFLRRAYLFTLILTTCLLATANGPSLASSDISPFAPSSSTTTLTTPTSLYESPIIRTTPAGIAIKVAEPPAGVFFRQPLSFDKVYTVSLKGNTYSGAPTLRIRTSNNPTQYLPLKDEQSFKLTGTSELELLLYSDAPFEYVVQSLTIAACDKCLSNSALKLIIDQHPSPAPEVVDATLNQAIRLNDWVANNSVILFYYPKILPEEIKVLEEIQASTYNYILNNPVALSFFKYFSPGKGATHCAGLAIFYHKLLKLYGIPSAVINFGAGNYQTHVATVVILGDKKNGYNFYYFDPFFNAYFADKSGTPAPLRHILLKKASMEDFFLKKHSTTGRRFLYLKESFDTLAEHIKQNDAGFDMVTHNYLLLKIPGWSLESFVPQEGTTNTLMSGKDYLVSLLNNTLFSISYAPTPQTARDLKKLFKQAGTTVK